MADTLPDFIIIGAMKCATTSMHYYLRHHPEIYMPVEKELNFFINEDQYGNKYGNYEKGTDWYHSKFNKSYKCNGEASPNYTKEHIFPSVPARINRLLPNVKLIFLYRDPAERCWSHYIHSLAIGDATPEPEKILTAQSNWVQTSRYYQQLSPYLSIFSSDQFFILNAEKLRENRQEALGRVFHFLGVSPFYDEHIYEKERHKSKVKTKRSAFNEKLVSSGIGQIVKRILPEEIKIWYKKRTEKPLQVPDFTPELKNRIAEYVQEDQKKFYELLKSGRIATF